MERGIALDMHVEEGMDCDAVVLPGGLEQVLDNLIDNALRYTPRDRAASVSASRGEHGRCIVEVADSGPGVPDEDVDRLFDRFWRGDSDEPGTGLGLAIVAHVVNLSGGSTTATNLPGGGLCIQVSLECVSRRSARPSLPLEQ